MAITAQVKKHFAADIALLEVSLALQWGLATGAIHIQGDATSATRRSKVVAAFRKKVESAINASKSKIKTLICDDLDYCKNKNGKAVNAAVVLVDAKLVVLTGIALPMGSFAAYIVKAGYLDKICNCPKKPLLSANIAAAKVKRATRKI